MSCLRWPEDSYDQAKRIVFPYLDLARIGVQSGFCTVSDILGSVVCIETKRGVNYSFVHVVHKNVEQKGAKKTSLGDTTAYDRCPIGAAVVAHHPLFSFV